MANALKLYCDWTTKTLVKSISDHSIYTLPTFYKYETVPMEVSIVQPGTTPISAWSKLDVSNIGLTVSINDTLDDAAPFCQQTTWTKDTSQNTLTGNLELNTSGLNGWLTGNSGTAYFEMSILEGSARTKIYQATITVAKGVTTTTSTSPNPAVEYLTKGDADGTYAKFFNDSGQTITLKSPAGTWTLVIGIDDDGQPYMTPVAVT